MNSDGVSQTNELKTLNELGITKISLNAKLQNNIQNEGNEVVSEITATRNGQNMKVQEVALLAQLGGYTYKETDGNAKYYTTKDSTILAAGNGTITVAKDVDAIITGGGNDNINITSSKDNVQINSGAGNDVITGNSHFQTVIYDKNKASYTVTQNGNTWTVKDNENNDTDTLTGIERIKFKDEIVHADSTNNNPVITDAALSTRNNKPLTINAAQLLSTATDKDGDYLKITAIGNIKNGKAEVDKDGNVIFTPKANFYGKATFEYTVDDAHGGKAIGTATINILPPAPTDPLFDDQWYLKAANILPVWDDYTGKGVKIGILDDGIAAHPDLNFNAANDNYEFMEIRRAA